VRLTFDPDFNIAYIHLRPRRQNVTTVAVSAELNVDVGPDGRAYGIEFLNANEQLASGRGKKLVVENRRSGRSREIRLAV
jgi:uncharacterized protein YuzE